MVRVVVRAGMKPRQDRKCFKKGTKEEKQRERDSVGTRMVDGGQEALPADKSNKTKDKGRKRKHLHSKGGSQCSRQCMDDQKRMRTREHRRI